MPDLEIPEHEGSGTNSGAELFLQHEGDLHTIRQMVLNLISFPHFSAGENILSYFYLSTGALTLCSQLEKNYRNGPKVLLVALKYINS